MTIAPVSSAVLVENIEVESASNISIVEKKESGTPVEPSIGREETKRSSLAGLSQPEPASATPNELLSVESSETNENITQALVEDDADLKTVDDQNLSDINGTQASTSAINDSESSQAVASISNERGSHAEPEPATSKTVTKEKPNSYTNQGEQAEYRRALAMVRDGQFEEAAESFNTFLESYPDSSYADNANYWIGETYYVTRDFEPALETFTGLIENFPDSPKVPDTRLKIGYIHYEQHDWSAAREALSSLVSAYPDTEVAQLANARLKRMDDEAH